MRRRLESFLIIASLLGSMGGHLAVLQTIAWSQMILNFSHHQSVGVSLRETFDGQHPCALCLRLRKISQSRDSLGLRQSNAPLDRCLTSPAAAEFHPHTGDGPPLFSATAHPSLKRIDTPPPEVIPA